MGEYITHIFPNKLRFVANYIISSSVDYFGIAVNAGSSNEDNDESGLAHFVEHCLFKGTQKHKASYILNRVECIGGELNAYTNKEETVIYTITPAGNLIRCMNLIADILINSTFPQQELEKEKSVIIEEIDSYLDSPAEAIFDEVEALLYRGTPFAHNILGEKETVNSFTTSDCLNWTNNNFTPENCVLFYSGNTNPDMVIKIAEKIFSWGETIKRKNITNNSFQSNYRFDMVRSGNNYHQSHVAFAFLLPPIDNPLQTEILLLNNILGGPALNSLLNVMLREKRGLVYQVDSTVTFYTIAGNFVIYYGCDHNDEKKCRDIVLRTIDKLSTKNVTQSELDKFKKQYIGQLTIAKENREQNIMSAARSILIRDYVLTYRELVDRINRITPLSLLEAAQYISPDKSNILVLN